MDIYRTAIPMRSFEHAAASRSLAEAIVVRLELTDGRIGWGETLPRPYVTGESPESVVQDLADILWPELCQDLSGPLTRVIDGRCINAAACTADLARLDATDQFSQVSGKIPARVSGVLGSADPARTAKRLRLMRWFGLKDFKLKLGFGDEVDAENLRIVHSRLGRKIKAGLCTLRVDVNGGWDAESTPDRVKDLQQYGICAVEQPVYCPAEELARLAERCCLPLIADESLLTRADADVLVHAKESVWWNLRISKNGGLTATADLVQLAEETGTRWICGCMVGESGILSAAQRRLLQCGPQPVFVEGNYGRFLLSDDLTRPSLRFGWGGKLKAMKGSGFGAVVSPEKIERYGKRMRTLHAK